MRRFSGFTIFEIIVVLLLMSILAATVIGRSITSSNLDLASATDKIRNQIRYAQAQAMKSAYESYPVWGVKSEGSEYWVFRGMNPDANEVRIPGGDYPVTGDRISETDLKGTVSDFTVFFDRIGKPYSAYTSFTNPNANTPIANEMLITVTGGSESRTITITPETGLVR